MLLNKLLISTREASALSGYSADYLSRLCRDEKIIGMRVGRSWLLDKESLVAFIEEQAEKKKKTAEELSRSRELEYKD
ncbi:helix-turn-helix domain-containing protein, partial [Patescibacteria group bacterium]|nr:helix-turn-helix domain-containing protein [Patescibacteria group bacterium]